MKGTLIAAVVTALTTAPFQCASDPDPNRRLEDTAPEALWALGERFRDEGNVSAREDTLLYLLEQYPRSREAALARLELGLPAPPPETEADP